ncbi:MAG: DUF819 family protein [Myxococcaceae bacterium]
MSVLQVLVALAFPAAALYLAKRVKPLGWVGPVGLCYLLGLFLANLPGLRLDRDAAMRMAEVAVPLSMPLLLFSTRLRQWVKLARPTLLAFALACVAVVLSATLHGGLFRGRVDEAWKVAGMLVGVFVGGTSNMSAIGLSLQVKNETFVLLNASDLVLGGAYLLFLLTVGQRVLWLFLPRFVRSAAMEAEVAERSPWRRDRALPMAGAMAAAVAVAALSLGATFLALGELVVPVVLLLITTLSLAGSLVRRLRENEGSYELGEYVLLVFCVAMGSLADIRELAGARSDLFLMVAAVQFTAIALHYALCALFRLDADVVLITSTATIFGPAFIGPVARSLKNRELVAGGITTALVGFALANYLGLATAFGLRP